MESLGVWIDGGLGVADSSCCTNTLSSKSPKTCVIPLHPAGELSPTHVYNLLIFLTLSLFLHNILKILFAYLQGNISFFWGGGGVVHIKQQ